MVARPTRDHRVRLPDFLVLQVTVIATGFQSHLHAEYRQRVCRALAHAVWIGAERVC